MPKFIVTRSTQTSDQFSIVADNAAAARDAIEGDASKGEAYGTSKKNVNFQVREDKPATAGAAAALPARAAARKTA